MAERRYWDAACFIAWFNEEPGRVETCGSILRAMEEGQIELVTSAFTITEVLLPKGGKKLAPELRQQVTEFFRKPQLILVAVDRPLAEAAQRYVWDFNVRPKDAIHVASAIRARAPALETYDRDLIKLSGRVGGNPVLQIREPVPVLGDERLSLFGDEDQILQ
jgi:predicted nucleic acid-binding protein